MLNAAIWADEGYNFQTPNQRSILTSVGEILLLVVRRNKHIVLGGLRLLLGEVLVLNLGKSDHCGSFCLEYGMKNHRMEIDIGTWTQAARK